MNLASADVVFRASLPDAEVGYAVSALHVVDEILDKADLARCPDHVQAGGDGLAEKQKILGDNVDLAKKIELRYNQLDPK